VLVVDRVPLVLVDQPHQVRELHRDHAAGLQQRPHAGDEVVQVGDVREHVVAEQQVGRRVPGHGARGLDAEELDQRCDPLLLGHLRDVRGRLDAEHRDLALVEELQQVAVVGGDLDDAAVRASASRSVI